MPVLTKDQIQKVAVPFKKTQVNIPEWNGFLFVREMTAKDRDIYEELAFSIDPEGQTIIRKDSYRAAYVAVTACDEEGKLIFSPSDVEWLGSQPASIINRLFIAAQALNRALVETKEKN